MNKLTCGWDNHWSLLFLHKTCRYFCHLVRADLSFRKSNSAWKLGAGTRRASDRLPKKEEGKDRQTRVKEQLSDVAVANENSGKLEGRLEIKRTKLYKFEIWFEVRSRSWSALRTSLPDFKDFKEWPTGCPSFNFPESHYFLLCSISQPKDFIIHHLSANGTLAETHTSNFSLKNGARADSIRFNFEFEYSLTYLI